MKRKKEIIIETERIVHSKKKALRRSVYEGAAASSSFNLGNSYITPFALILNSSNLHVGILSSLSGLAAPVAQLFGSNLMESQSRKRIVMNFVLLEALMWVPIIGLAVMFRRGVFQEFLPWVLVAFYTLLVGFGGVAYPAWFSWMGDLVPEKERGRYFAKRNRAVGVVGLAALAIGAFILDAFKTKGFALIGFMILFALAFTFRFISYLLFNKQFNPKFRLKRGYYFSLWDFIKRYDNFGKFAFYKASFFFSIMIAGPFFTVYMLRDLGFSYVAFMAVTISASIFYLLAVPLAGKFSDKYGNLKLLRIAGIIFIFTPIPWLFLKTPWSLILVPQLLSGIANAAFVISVNNFTYDAVSQQKRGLCVAYSSLLVGFGMFFGSLFGGFISSIKFGFLAPILMVFLISSVFRLLVALFFLPQIQEVRKAERLPPPKIDLAHPFKTLNYDIGWFKNFFK
jgi:MFS family permease